MNDTARFMPGRPVLFALLIAALVAGSISLPLPRASALATTWYVANGASGDCTLAHPCGSINFAIFRAAPGDLIIIGAGTYFENLSIAESLTLQGAGSDATIVDGGDIGLVVEIATGSPINVSLSGLTFQHGSGSTGGGILNSNAGVLSISNSSIISNTATNGGGGIFTQGTLTLDNVIIRGNTSNAQSGGGLRNSGIASLNNVTIINNTAQSGGGIGNLKTMYLTNVTVSVNTSQTSGGGINNAGGQLFAFGGTIFNNTAQLAGGGIMNKQLTANGQMQLNGTLIQNNTSVISPGGGIYNDSFSTANLVNVTLNNNQAQGGGGIFNNTDGQLALSNSVIQNNTAQTAAGGGISNLGTLFLASSTLSGNRAATLQGGGLSNSGSATLVNVTISNNMTSSNGGAAFNDGGKLQIYNTTIANNTDPGITNNGGTITVINTIIEQSNGSVGGVNCNGGITSYGHNLESGNSCGFGGTDHINTNPLLGLLQDNGGPTPTHALAYSSPAIDAGYDAPNCPSTDQRGVTRPQGNHCDIGAYEAVGVGNSTPQTIPANGCTTSTITFNSRSLIGTIDVGVNLAFVPRGNLQVRLISPNNVSVRLLAQNAADNGQNLNALFTDSGVSIVPNTIQNLSPVYFYQNKPSTSLALLNNTSVKGTWKLEVCNNGAATGTLNQWLISVPNVVTTFKVYMPVIRRNWH